MKISAFTLFLLFILIGIKPGYAQEPQKEGNPFARFGTKVPVATFSHYPEFHDGSQVVEIDRVKYDTQRKEIIGFVDAGDIQHTLSPVIIAMTPDPHAKKYYSVSPYAYALNNPVRFSDPDGKDVKDKVVGFGIGVLTNIIPTSGNLRDSYTPSDPPDYNTMLRNVDYAAVTVGEGMIDVGGGGMAAGGAVVVAGTTVTAVSGGTAAIAGVPIAVVGGTMVEAGAVTAGTGMVLTANGKKNQSEGYNRGGIQLQSKTLWKGSGEHLDVENPAPGKRPGQIHFQDAKGNKYIYNIEKNSFFGRNNKTGEWDQKAPNSINKKLEDQKFQEAINKGLRYLE